MYVIRGNKLTGGVSKSRMNRLPLTDGALSFENVYCSTGYKNSGPWHEVGGVKWFTGLVHSLKGRIDEETGKQIVQIEGIFARLTFPLNKLVNYELVFDGEKMIVICDHQLKNENGEVLMSLGQLGEIIFQDGCFFDSRGNKIL